MPLSYSIIGSVSSLFSNPNDPAKRKLLEDLEAQGYRSTTRVDWQVEIINNKIPLSGTDIHSSKMNFTPTVADAQIQSPHNAVLVESMGSIASFGEGSALAQSDTAQPSYSRRVNTAQFSRRLHTGSTVAAATLFGVGIVTVAVLLFRNYHYIFGPDSSAMPVNEQYIGYAAVGLVVFAIAIAGVGSFAKGNSNSSPDEENNTNLNLDEERSLCAPR